MRRSGRRRVEAEAAVADQPDAAVEDLEAAAGESEADGGEDAVAVGASVRARAMNGLSREHRRREGGAAGVGVRVGLGVLHELMVSYPRSAVDGSTPTG